ncbi:MAG TPA: MBL fold metallo-hydrolase [Terriglobales bacterium]|nr:MBL fold metallo-hydrolase [Terriglobales bacterium]
MSRQKLFFAQQAAAILLIIAAVAVLPARAEPLLKQIGPGLYAYISDNDGSANSTFLVGTDGILVVDTGIDAKEGGKLLQKIRSVSDLPVKFIVNTHYHPDHQGGNATVGPAATVISTRWTRDRTLALMQSQPAFSNFHPAKLTFEHKVTIHLDPYIAEIYFPGKAHTSGDALVYFPQQHAIAMGDLFLTNSCPAMDQGSAAQWIKALDQVLALPVESVVPGHFELAGKPELQRFRDYLSDLYSQVEALYKKGATLQDVRRDIHMEKYKDFRQYEKYEATFADNAATIYQQLQQH